MKKRELLFCLSLVCMVPIHILGAKPIDTQEQLNRSREQQLARERRGLERDELQYKQVE